MEKLLVAELYIIHIIQLYILEVLFLPLWGSRCMDRNKFSVVLTSDLLVGVCRG